MVVSLRSPSSQSKHDQEVKRIADDYKDRGFTVQADISGYPAPASISGYQPDVRAKLEFTGFEAVIEVETPDSVDSDHAKQQDTAFSNWERQDPRKRLYRRVVTD